MTMLTGRTDYLHRYEADSAFTPDYEGSYYHEPWVSYTIENKEVHYNKRSTYSVAITYTDRGHAGSPVTRTYTGSQGSPIRFETLPAPEPWDEHEFLGWATVEWPTYAQVQTPGFLTPGGSETSADSDTTLYAVYSTTFQGLINEGYVDVDLKAGETSDFNLGVGMFTRANGYPKELVVDFMDVFNSETGKRVSKTGVVGEGTLPNIFLFPYHETVTGTGKEMWLTPDEWYDLYNDTLLSHGPVGSQFRGIDWSGKDSITIKYGSHGVGTETFGPWSPRVVNIYFESGSYWYMNKTFGNPYAGCSAEIINFSQKNGEKVSVGSSQQSHMGLNAAFECATNLKEINGLETSATTVWSYTFDGATGIEVIPTSDFGNSITVVNSMIQTFNRCSNLEEIEPVLFVSAVTDTNATFSSCPKLDTMYLHGINALRNKPDPNDGTVFPNPSGVTWWLEGTNLSQTSVDYIVANLYECGIPADPDFEYKKINFPASATLSSEQITRLRNNGWIPYIAGVEQDIV